jgi:cation-transporting ATPase E
MSKPTIGLTAAEAARRAQAGQSNRITQSSSRSLGDIFIANFLNLPNLILLAIIIVLTAVGKPADGFVTGGVVVINILIGTFQEYRSKRKLDQIALLTRPKVTVLRDGQAQEVDQSAVVLGDAILFKAGDQAVVDGTLIHDPANPNQRVDVDESALTGESDLIPKRAGDSILSGSFAVVGEGIFMAEKVGEESFAQKITTGARQFTVSVTPLQRQINIIVRTLLVTTIALSLLIGLAAVWNERPFEDVIEDIAVVISLIPQGLLLMITVAYALGAVRIAAKGALVQQINAVESLSNVDVLCMDKTGTLTTNRILFDALHPLTLESEAAFRSLLGDYIASTGAKNRTAEAVAQAIQGNPQPVKAEIPFSSARKWSGASFESATLRGTYLLGAPEMLYPNLVGDLEASKAQVTTLANQGLRVLLFARSEVILGPQDIPQEREADLPAQLTPLGLVSFSDELRPNVQQVLAGFRQAQVGLRVISGDNPSTVAALAYQAGFDPQTDPAISGVELAQMSDPDFAEAVRTHTIFGRITPEQKSRIVDILRGDGHYVAMMGDGVNDVLSLKKAQVGIAMEDGSQATRAVADIVLLGNQFEILPQAFLEGQRILNGMNDSARLFLTRSVYIALLIITVGFIGSEFPFSPRHNAILTSLPVGIPAFFLAYWAKSGQPSKSLLRLTAEFVLPTGLTLFLLNLALWYVHLEGWGGTVEVGRSLLTIASLLGALWVILLAEHDRSLWRTQPLWYLGDLRRVGLTLAMLALFVVVMLIVPLREFFEMTTPTSRELALILAGLGIWIVSLYLLWRYDVLEHLVIPDYRPPANEPSQTPAQDG